jgi:hypothetical protein
VFTKLKITLVGILLIFGFHTKAAQNTNFTSAEEVNAKISQGINALDRGEAKKAFRILQPLANRQHPKALAAVGVILARDLFVDKGRKMFGNVNWSGVPSNSVKELAMLRRSAAIGSPEGKYYLGFYLVLLSSNDEKSAGWDLINESADLGFLRAQWDLHLFHLNIGDNFKIQRNRHKAIESYSELFKWLYLYIHCKFRNPKIREFKWNDFYTVLFSDDKVISRAEVTKMGNDHITRWKNRHGSLCINDVSK